MGQSAESVVLFSDTLYSATRKKTRYQAVNPPTLTHRNVTMAVTKNVCTVCGVRRTTEPRDGAQVCSACNGLIDVICTQPDIVRELWRQYQDEPILLRPERPTIDSEMELPEVLDGKRYRTVDRDRNKWYLSVSEVDGLPVEIFASTAFDRDHQLQSRISTLTTITRLISLILRHIFLREPLTFDKVLKQLQRSSRQKDDLPDMLNGVLRRYSKPDASAQ
jgi:hypothetical protein